MAPLGAQVLFEDDFESGLDAWTFPLGQGHALVDTGDGARGSALKLVTTDHPSYALMRGSDQWEGVRIEGAVMFPEDVHNYLGFIYRFVDDGRRMDFGSLYIKGNNSYVRVNPHFDTNVGRTLYEEYRTPLTGGSAIEIQRWQTFALEVVGSEAHLYVGGASEPAVTFPHWEGTHGSFGFKARNPGGEVWIDDIRVTSLERFTWSGPPRPQVAYEPEELLADWEVLGPLVDYQPAIESGPYDPARVVRDQGRSLTWQPFATDARGAVITSSVTEYRLGRRSAYFHARVRAAQAGPARLQISSVDAVAIWVNGVFEGFGGPHPNAWWDFWKNPEHAGVDGGLQLRQGDNHVIVRVVGGSYATGGFFMRVAPAPEG